MQDSLNGINLQTKKNGDREPDSRLIILELYHGVKMTIPILQLNNDTNFHELSIRAVYA